MAVTQLVRFKIDCVPPTTSHHHKKIVKTKAFTKLADRDELVHAKQLLEVYLLRHRILAPVPAPIRLTIAYVWPWLAKHGKRVREAGVRIPHTSKPDLTNVTKTLEDRLAKMRFIEDDRGVAQLVISKWWGPDPGIFVQIETF